jgi:RNAse (barnase) inhibitor barstar
MENLSILDKAKINTEFVIIEIDGEKVTTLRSFYEEIAKAMHFPDYFGFNLDSLDELLNDLSWIEDEKLAVYINNSEHFLIKERNEGKILTLIDLLDATCEDWKWMEPDNELSEEHEDYIPKKELVFYFSASEYINVLLNNNS